MKNNHCEKCYKLIDNENCCGCVKCFVIDTDGKSPHEGQEVYATCKQEAELKFFRSIDLDYEEFLDKYDYFGLIEQE